MKKRSIFTIALAIALTAVISVGATLAYLTAEDTEVVNTFNFAEGMSVTIKEPAPDKVAQVANEVITAKDPQKPEKGYIYSNVVPGQELNKAPEITATTSVNSYVFVRVSGASAAVAPTGITTGWTTAVQEDHNNGLYYKTVDAGAKDLSLGTIFTKVLISETANIADGLNDITIDVFEIQRNGISETEAINQAKAHFGMTETTGA